MTDPDFTKVYLPAIIKGGKIPSHTEFEESLKKNPNNQYTPYIKKALKYSEKLKETDRVKFNNGLALTVKLAKEWAAAGKKMDMALIEVGKILKKHLSSKEVQDCSKFVVEAVEQRTELYKVWKALQTLNDKEVKAEKENIDYQKDVAKEENANTGIIVTIVLAILLTVGGVTYCKCAKKACFAEKDAVEAEGGQVDDRSLFKNEIKSKKSIKKSRKESLMPAFKVAEEQA